MAILACQSASFACRAWRKANDALSCTAQHWRKPAARPFQYGERIMFLGPLGIAAAIIVFILVIAIWGPR
jgi:hypothetical protein